MAKIKKLRGKDSENKNITIYPITIPKAIKTSFGDLYDLYNIFGGGAIVLGYNSQSKELQEICQDFLKNFISNNTVNKRIYCINSNQIEIPAKTLTESNIYPTDLDYIYCILKNTGGPPGYQMQSKLAKENDFIICKITNYEDFYANSSDQINMIVYGCNTGEQEQINIPVSTLVPSVPNSQRYNNNYNHPDSGMYAIDSYLNKN